MFEQAQLILYGQFTEERAWGLVLLALTLAVALPSAWIMAQQWVGWMQYVAAVGAGFVMAILAAMLWGKVLSRVRKRWFA